MKLKKKHEIKKKKKIKLYNTLLNSLSYELRTPIATILGAVDMLNESKEFLYINIHFFYQAENWEYKASFTSDNTPWFFNGLRIQIFSTKNLKIGPWIINGWQSYGRFNAMPGFGANVTYIPSSNLELITNNYYGSDTALIPDRKKFHSDNSVLWRYYNRPKSNGITKMPFSLTGDVGFEKGSGVNGFNNSNPDKPAQYFLSTMFYNRVWFAKDKMAWTVGGGWIENPKIFGSLSNGAGESVTKSK